MGPGSVSGLGEADRYEPTGPTEAAGRGQVVAYTAISDVWAQARTLALTPSPLAGRRYDLRRAAVSLWLNEGLPATEVAERAGHGVQVLLRVHGDIGYTRRHQVERLYRDARLN